MEFEIFNRLKEAYETTTHNNNRFLKALNAIRWDASFTADGEHYFLFGNMTLTVENLNPFAEAWKPEAIFSDGGVLSF